ncbi:MAG: FtsH protease activity modulator HflK [Isosphaeraceae bacterium]
MKKPLTYLAIGLGVACMLFVAAGLCMVAPGEVAVVRRFGRLIEPPWGPGLHWRFPLGVDRLDRVRSDAVRQFTIGQSGPPSADQEPSSGEALTGDLNLVNIQATVQYRVANPVDYVLRIEDVEPVLIRGAEASLSRALSRLSIDAVLRSERRRIAEESQADIQAAADRLPLGVTILGVSLTEARPPIEVAADFAAAQSAESARDRRINDATTDAAVKLTGASARAQAIQETARADAERMILNDRAEAQRFLALMTEARRSRDLTIRRLYIESLQQLLVHVKRKLIMPEGDETDLTVLGLPAEASPRNIPAPALQERAP